MSNGVRGDLLRWARKQQNLTMRWIHNHGGPSPSYQCEVEKGRKREVLSEMLSSWIALLNVNEAFARGQITKYHGDPCGCHGAAAEIGTLVTGGQNGLPAWSSLTEQERVRAVLRLVARESRNLPRVVLAWVLDLKLDTLDALLVGAHPVMRPHLEATMHITTLPETFFTEGSTARFEQFIPVFRRALDLGLSAEALLGLMSPPFSPSPLRRRPRKLQDNGPLGAGDGG